MSQCPELVAQLQNIKELQNKLNHEIGEYSDLNQTENARIDNKTKKLAGIYAIKKEILNTELLVEKKMGRLIDKLYGKYSEAELEAVYNYLKNKIEAGRLLNKKELILLYETDGGLKVKAHIEIGKLLRYRDPRKDLAEIFDCKPEQITAGAWENPPEEIVFYYGSFTDDFGWRNRIKYPRRVGGDFTIVDRKIMDNAILPEKVDGSIFMNDTERISNTVFPNIVDDNLYLQDLELIENSTMPKRVGKHLIMRTLKSAKGLRLPRYVGNILDLDRLESAEGIIFPKEVGGDIYLDRLKTIKGLFLPDIIGGSVCLHGLNKADQNELMKRYPNLKIA